jgi:hypothetical protein
MGIECAYTCHPEDTTSRIDKAWQTSKITCQFHGYHKIITNTDIIILFNMILLLLTVE